jgi:hypothetical protein
VDASMWSDFSGRFPVTKITQIRDRY